MLLIPARQISGEIRENSPLVGCITNTVVTNYTANLLLAVGAAPAMVDIVGEAGLFTGVSDATLINLGTPTPEQREAALEAASFAHAAGRIWVLDPVAVGSLPVRTDLAKDLLTHLPVVIRGNASEIIALAGKGVGGRGVDSSDSVGEAIVAAQALSQTYGSIVAISGEVDAIVQGNTVVRIAGGSALLTKVTGAGCALGALIGAAASTNKDILSGVVAAHVMYAAASEKAAARCTGPGTFGVYFLDELAALTDADLDRISVSVEKIGAGDTAGGMGQ
ncbi:hydroxyethylthiazole kinase, sugar kinase family [Corynebacterium mustelae]|uniref:Hydroxyethylthiazole kinase n=1 Tax=Corynebacterium mustelae TaxID=571915 RepID=A0A0G3GY66_9CORY|nr:hydroxyethylthiazole kinase [Corynebacterium mustelae]AKK05480.1 hydroxyethylthiazole kinase, sugar kinase family [Corynebacterium mustelae]